MITKVIMPEMGEGVVEGTVARWLVSEGDFVKQYDPILEIETDKVTTEATAEESGTILQICVAEGAVAPVGTVLAYIGEPGEAIPENGKVKTAVAPPEPEQTIPSPATAVPAAPPPAPNQPYTGRISPVVSRIAAEHNVDLSQIQGTGLDGRITKKDILAYVEQRAVPTPPPTPKPTPVAEPVQPARPAMPSSPTPVSAPASPVSGEILPLTSIRRSIAEHMVRSKQTSPHVTTIFEFDFTNVDKHRRAHKEQFARDGANLTFTAYIVAATVAALKKHPLVNSTWMENGIELKREINIGMATAVDDGLIVPVIKNADSLNLLGLARSINDLAQRARSKQLKPADVQGGTFSITNHGVSGSLFATPIINQPQCGILGVGMIEKRVKVINEAIAIRPMAYVGLTFDHRILDGALADNFVASIKKEIENWQ
ncbi:MAG: 2-oxo acid dehydrogenase subunit E2 [Chloroflexi bacterium]|nr:2-oxo acid dehydrogenase subunit E2 [Ardenticatenaceae bacterium]MBL1127483.1 2-oxo acid dehydrogenase subunit E2 [Chloroflexota bacterium]NOG33546.1 2-oxo acid dehydrogenase subunit E2 [Chloroflexota bacterium]GIK55758.1 MAG: dihydrolipoamide acetyltransferase component of pyruvate dehydrogenase complex [Chloroflexota bacterium]